MMILRDVRPILGLIVPVGVFKVQFRSSGFFCWCGLENHVHPGWPALLNEFVLFLSLRGLIIKNGNCTIPVFRMVQQRYFMYAMAADDTATAPVFNRVY